LLTAFCSWIARKELLRVATNKVQQEKGEAVDKIMSDFLGEELL
jgi:hypothetical protein